ncbi:MAG TPA: hypothetical protein VFF30_18310 [Nitrososphaerales archaeon]|nr:hypothetical protein [Nitrososphaerales archaeon]
MSRCVYDQLCKEPVRIMFKGRLLCSSHARFVQEQLDQIIRHAESREKRIIPMHEKIGINNPRYACDESGHIVKLRGTHLTITKEEIVALRTSVSTGIKVNISK